MELNVQKNQTPIYRQLYEHLVRQIVDGTLQADSCLPSIRVVARELSIAVITVKTAYEMLERDGFIYTVPGKGCFVSGTLPRQKADLARERLQTELGYYKELGLGKDELIHLIEELY